MRGHSVVFAALMALGLMGLSVIGWVKWGLAAIGLHWAFLLVVPSVLVMVAAKKEMELMPEVQERKKWARGLVAGALIAAVLGAWLFPAPPEPEPERRPPVRRIGPPGK